MELCAGAGVPLRRACAADPPARRRAALPALRGRSVAGRRPAGGRPRAPLGRSGGRPGLARAGRRARRGAGGTGEGPAAGAGAGLPAPVRLRAGRADPGPGRARPPGGLDPGRPGRAPRRPPPAGAHPGLAGLEPGVRLPELGPQRGGGLHELRPLRHRRGDRRDPLHEPGHAPHVRRGRPGGQALLAGAPEGAEAPLRLLPHPAAPGAGRGRSLLHLGGDQHPQRPDL